jgi:AcrR family transcriptional regulator
MTGKATRSRKEMRRTRRGDLTRARILKIAEQMFAEHGLDGVSMRTLVARSKVNLAAVNYNFGSKRALFEQVFERRAEVITEKRLQLLAECRARPGRPPLVSQIVEAFLRPVIENYRDGGGAAYARLRMRLAAERSAWARDLPSRFFDESSRLFLNALAAALPKLPLAELYWRFNILLAAMYFTIANPARIEYLSRGLVDMSDEEEAIAYLVEFFTNAFLAAPFLPPSPRRTRSSSRRRRAANGK